MTCRHRDDVGALLLGALTPDEALAAEAHILGCAECAAQRRDLAIVRGLLDTVDTPDAEAELDEAPARLRDDVVARLVATPQHDRRRDVRLVLLGAAAALVLLLGVIGAVRLGAGDDGGGGQALELVGAGVAPKAWGIANLHERVDGTIVDLEAGDLPTDGTRFTATVTGPEAVLASQTFTANSDGWAQILLATSRPMRAGDVIEVAKVGDAAALPVLRCNCKI